MGRTTHEILRIFGRREDPQVKIISPQYVKPFVRRQKNDGSRAHRLRSGAAVQVVKVGNPFRPIPAKVGHGEEAAHGLRRLARVFHARIAGRLNVVISTDDEAQIGELCAQVLRDRRQVPGVETNSHGMASGLEDARARGVSFDYA
jgi:hypothetical protein